MDIRFILIIAAILALFVSMGKNPFEPPPGYVPPDEFKDGIRAKIQESQTLNGPNGLSALGNNNFNALGNKGYQGSVVNPGGAVGQSGGIVAPPNYAPQPNAANNGTPPSGINPFTGQPYNPGDGLSQPQPSPYQTAPEPSNPSPFQSLPTPGSYLNLPSYIPRFMDNKGRTLAFAGSEAYTTDHEGKLVILPDGNYTLANGQSFIIKNGKHWWPVDANKM